MSVKLPECEKHPPIKQEYYCIDCSELLCKRCMMERHRLHNYDETEVVVVSFYASLQENVQSAKESLEIAEGAAGNLDSSKVCIATDKSHLKAKVEAFFDQSRKQLDRCQSSLMETIDNISESKVESLNAKAQQITAARSDLLEAIENLQKLANDEIRVTSLTEGKQYIEAAKKQREIISAITHSLSEEVSKAKLSVEFKEESPKRVAETLSKLCSLSGETSVSGETSIRNDNDTKPVEFNLSDTDLKVFDSEEPVHETPVNNIPFTRIKSLPVLPTISSSNKLAKRRSPTVSTIEQLLPFKVPTSVISLTQKDRFIGENIHPCGIAVGTNNLIIVTDLHSNSVKVLAKTGKVIDTIGSSRGSTTFRGPCAVALDEDDNIFIVERETRRIHKFTNGNLVELAKVGRKLVEPWGIAVANGKIFVSDWQGCCIHVFEHSGGNKCTHISSIGSDFLKQPAGITINPRGNLVVADQENHCVWILTQEGRSLIHPIGGNKCDQFGQLYQPFGVTVTSKGLLVVSDKGNSCISVFTEQGDFVECFGRNGSQPGEFNQPRHLCVNSSGQIVVADELNQRIQIFDLT